MLALYRCLNFIMLKLEFLIASFDILRATAFGLAGFVA